MASRLGKLNRKGSKKSQDVGVAILNGKPALQVNWGGRIYGAPLTLVGSSNIKEALNIGDIRASGNIIFDIGSSFQFFFKSVIIRPKDDLNPISFFSAYVKVEFPETKALP